MAYFNGKKILFSTHLHASGGVDKTALEAAINEKTETISTYTPVILTDISKYNSYLSRTLIVTEDIVKNGLYILQVAEPKENQDGYIPTPYFMYGGDVDHIHNEITAPNPNIGEVTKNFIEEYGLSVGYVIGFSQKFEQDGFVWVTSSNVECVTKENLDNILTNM